MDVSIETGIAIGGVVVGVASTLAILKTSQARDEKDDEARERRYQTDQNNLWSEIGKIREWTRKHQDESMATRLEIAKDINDVKLLVATTLGEVNGKLTTITNELSQINQKLDSKADKEERRRS